MVWGHEPSEKQTGAHTVARMTEGPVLRQMVTLALPLLGGVFSIISFNVADTYFVGQLGTRELAAMTFTFPVVTFLGSLALGLGIGASSALARAIGEGSTARVRRLVTDSLALSLLIVTTFVIFGLFTIEPLFTALGAKPELIPLIREYMEIWYLGMPFLVIPMVGNGLIRATGDTRFPAMIMVMAAIVNVILDPILIFGFMGIEGLGLKGAALATIFSRATTFIAALWVLYVREELLTFQKTRLANILSSWWSILYVGLPAAATNVITPITIGFITALLAPFGPEAVAAFGIATRLESFSLIPFMALASVVGPFVGQNWGAMKRDRIRLCMNYGSIFSLGWGLAVAVLFLVTTPYIVPLFNTNPEVIAIAEAYLWIVPVSYVGYGVMLVSASAFNGLGRPLPGTLMTVVRMFILYLPLAYLGRAIWGINGIFLATFVANLGVGLGAYIYNRMIFRSLLASP